MKGKGEKGEDYEQQWNRFRELVIDISWGQKPPPAWRELVKLYGDDLEGWSPGDDMSWKPNDLG